MRRFDVEKFNEVIEKLRFLATQGLPIIVEGKRDREALKSFGIDGRILTITSSLDIVAERAARQSNEVIILTDYDRRGKILAGKLRDLLLDEGVKPNLDIRHELKRACDVEFIEELPSLFLKFSK